VTAPHRPFFFPNLEPAETTYVGDLLRRETFGGALALVAAAIAVVWANSTWGDVYESMRHYDLGPLDLEHWAADGALTLFFFVAGLELKREFTIGSLRRPADAAVPVVAAICGVALPAAIYLVVNGAATDGDLGGWAVPAATDIAFALAVLAVVGSSLPTALRAFLLTLAVVDDLIVIVIIAVAYTEELSPVWLVLAVACFLAWVALQRMGVNSVLVLLPLAVATWWCVHESGVHATIAGVVLGLLTQVDRVEHLEHLLSPLSSGVAVPFFALMAAGVVLEGGGELARNPIVVGVVLGLVVGKPLGVFGGTWLVTRFTRAELNEAISYRDVVGLAVLAGIGFTVSLLVADLSFTGEPQDAAKTAVLLGSLVSALLGALLLGHRDRFRATP
jgi:NhaA family Na+:H+ antiporter